MRPLNLTFVLQPAESNKQRSVRMVSGGGTRVKILLHAPRVLSQFASFSTFLESMKLRDYRWARIQPQIMGRGVTIGKLVGASRGVSLLYHPTIVSLCRRHSAWVSKVTKDPYSLCEQTAPTSLQLLIRLENRTGRELNLDSIQAIEKQIEEHKKAIIKLNRARNSLLNISTLVPPEILGTIFHWTTVLGRERSISQRGSYNFLFVCYHWFEVASCTPELWSSWGNSLRDWGRRYTCPRTARLDLELTSTRGSQRCQVLDGPLRDALQDRATRDTIWRVKLISGGSELLNSIISSITVGGEGARSNSVESFTLFPRQPHSGPAVELSNFFSCYHFPKLRHLRLFRGCNISSWDSLTSRTTVLTTLSLIIDDCPAPTMSQLLSIISSNPNLQCLELSRDVLPDASGVIPSFQVSLPCLKQLGLSGDFRNVFGLLNRLVLPEKVDDLNLDLLSCSAPDISQTLGRYLGDHVRRRGKRQEGLALRADRVEHGFTLTVGDVNEFNTSHLPDKMNWFMDVVVKLVKEGTPVEDECEKPSFDCLAHLPLDHIVYYETPHCLLKSEDLSVGMANLVELRPIYAHLPDWFVEPVPRGTHTYAELLPSLKYLSLNSPTLSGGDWSPLTTFLSRRASAGNRLEYLTIRECSHMCPSVVKDIKRMVKSFRTSWSKEPKNLVCPLVRCSGHREDQRHKGSSRRDKRAEAPSQ